MMRIISLFLATFLIFSLHAKKEKQPMPFGEGKGHAQMDLPEGYSAPARWNPTDNWDYFISGAFIYWLGAEECLDLGQRVQSNSVNELGRLSIVNSDFKFKPGFKLTVGSNMRHDHWTALIEYTRLHYSTNTTSRIPPGASSILELGTWWEIPGSNINDGTDVALIKGRWKLDLDILDFEFARDYYLGYSVIFRPFVGPRTLWIDQELDASTTRINETSVFTARWRQETWGIGPRLGTDMRWEMGYGLRTVGSLACSLLFRSYKVRGTIPNDPNFGETSVLRTSKYHFVSSNAEIGMGLAWGTYFAKEKAHVDLQATYEFHYFWNENYMRKTTDVIDTFIDAQAGDLTFQGLTLRARFDF